MSEFGLRRIYSIPALREMQVLIITIPASFLSTRPRLQRRTSTFGTCRNRIVTPCTTRPLPLGFPRARFIGWVPLPGYLLDRLAQNGLQLLRRRTVGITDAEFMIPPSHTVAAGRHHLPVRDAGGLGTALQRVCHRIQGVDSLWKRLRSVRVARPHQSRCCMSIRSRMSPITLRSAGISRRIIP